MSAKIRLLNESIENNDLDSFQSLWSEDLSQQSENLMEKLLLSSIQSKAHGIVKFILSKQQLINNINFIGNDGYNALSAAIMLGEVEIVKQLLLIGSESNASLPNGLLMLHIAALTKQNQLLQLLLKHQAVVDELDNDLRTPLMYSALNNDIKSASVLINYGAKINRADKIGMTALMFAAENGFYELCDLLLTKGADQTLQNLTQHDAKQLALKGGHKNIVSLLESYKLDQTSETGWNKWHIFCYTMTLLVPDFVLKIFGFNQSEQRMAWREKIVFCQFVLLISSIFALFSFGLSTLICSPIPAISIQQVQKDFAWDTDSLNKYVIVRGYLYDVGVFVRTNSHPPGGARAQPPVIAYVGKDASGLFPLLQTTCPKVPAKSGCVGKECHDESTFGTLKNLGINQMVSYSWDLISNSNRFMVYSNKVYDVGTYLKEGDFFVGDTYSEAFRKNIGKDASFDLQNMGISQDIVSCMDQYLLVGRVEGQSTGCFASNLFILVLIIVFSSVMLAKFIGAVFYTTQSSFLMNQSSFMKRSEDFVMIFVTCYSEGHAAIEKTLNSIVNSDYPDDQKLIYIVADGIVVGHGNSQPTGDIAATFIDFDSNFEQGSVELYQSVGHDETSVNRVKIYSGFVKNPSKRVPVILAVKIGNVEESSNSHAGNRGKRDSQLMIMNLFSHVLTNERLSPMEFSIFKRAKYLTGVYLDKIDHVLMIDADTEMDLKSLTKMVKCMELQPQTMALCGETKLENKWDSPISMCQVFEYYVAHYFGKSFESLFGGVTCLPGCFSMYRIRQIDEKGNLTPILANPDLVEEYGSCDTKSLHRKNLLLLGEDRFLTTLLLKNFPNRDTIFLPDAFCYTTVPSSFFVLLSQRRRWINSTVHNLYELMFVKKICGIFCFSMQFIVFMDLIGTLLSPAAFAILVYIIVQVALEGITQSSLLPLVFICMVVSLNVILVLFPPRNLFNLFWMVIYLISTPLWQFILPVQAFWQSDNFTWGKTRKLGETKKEQQEQSTNETNIDKVPLKRWHEWENENRLKKRVTKNS